MLNRTIVFLVEAMCYFGLFAGLGFITHITDMATTRHHVRESSEKAIVAMLRKVSTGAEEGQ